MKFLESGLSARVDDGIQQEIAAYVPEWTHRRRNIPTREICQTRRAEVSVRFYKSLRIILIWNSSPPDDGENNCTSETEWVDLIYAEMG